MSRKIAPLLALIALGNFAGAAVAAPVITCKYDALGRLTSVSYPNGTTVTYTYDSVGNRTQRNTSAQVVVLPLIGGLVIPLQH